MKTNMERAPWLALVSIVACVLPGIASAQQIRPVPNRAPLQPNAFNPLPLGAVRPLGWLKDQLVIQASGLTGHLDEFWNDVGGNSAWLGGTGEAWERGPYYLDGLLPLAYQLNDPKLKAKADKWVEWSLTHQRPDGEFGPAQNDDWWPRTVMLKVLTQYGEVSGDKRVIPFMTRYFHYELKTLPQRPLQDWGKYRWQDNVLSVLWLYNRTGGKELLKLAQLLHDQGYDWQSQFAHFKYTYKETMAVLGKDPAHKLPEEAMQTHGVNNAMALKVSPVWFLMTGSASDRAALDRQVALLDQYHGLPNGMFSGDEHLAGPNPSQGIELCAVVETMFSFEEALAVLGDARLADRLERAAYNALPGTLSNDMWSHQYDQQPNQIACNRAHRQWSTNGDDSNLFGLAPHFGCCTANLHQGWPKFVSSLWMESRDGGLFAAAYAPSEVKVGLPGGKVTVEETTQYPFHGTVHFSVKPEGIQTFPLVLRIPAWASSATVMLNGKLLEKRQSSCSAENAARFVQGDSHCDPKKMLIRIERQWRPGDQVEVTFPLTPRVSHWFNQAAVFERGPLVFSLPLQADWTELKAHSEKSADWQLNPTKKWNYGVELGDCDAEATAGSITATPFDVAHPGVVMTVHARQVPQWTVSENSAGPLPESPVTGTGPVQALRLVPYGSAKLRITEFPYLQTRSSCPAAGL